MAFTVQQIRNSALTSILGQRLGLDGNDFVTGPKDSRAPIEDFDDSTGTTATNYGVTNVYTDPANGIKLYGIQAPEPGCRKTLHNTGPSTAGVVFNKSGVTFVGGSITSLGATAINLVKQNCMVELLGLSTSQYAVLNSLSSGGVSSAYPGITYSATASS